MESFAVDVDPAQIVQWLLAEEREGRRDYSIYAARSYLREPPPETAESRLGDEEREDVDQVTVIGMLEIAPFAYADGWTLRIRAEDPLGPRTPEDEPVPLPLERLRGTLNPEKLFQTIPGIGPELAARIHERLHVDTLEGLEIAAHDGRLEQVPGIGKHRAELIRSLLAECLGRPRLRRLKLEAARPEVDLLLDVDREYRRRVLAGELKLITPKRFNPKGEA